MTLDETIEKLKEIREEFQRGDVEVRHVVFPQIIAVQEVVACDYRGTKYVELR